MQGLQERAMGHPGGTGYSETSLAVLKMLQRDSKTLRRPLGCSQGRAIESKSCQ